MAILRVETLTYGVEDLAASTRYYEDWGLEKLDGGAAGATFRTLENQIILLRSADDGSLPAVPESGSTMREAVWGVDGAAALDALGAELSRDRDVGADADGVLHSRDETGFAIGFTVANPAPAGIDAPRINVDGSVNRVNERVIPEPRATPIRIGHIVYLIPEEGRERATAFYRDRLGFRRSDLVTNLGEFMRCEGAMDHHSLFLMWVRKTAVKFDHAAFELSNVDEVMVGGQEMKSRGWQSASGPGRQKTGSHIYWHFENPAGGTTEYFTDMDRFDENWEPRVWEGKRGENNVWYLGDD